MISIKKVFAIIIILSVTLATFIVSIGVIPKSAKSESTDKAKQKSCKVGIFLKTNCENNNQDGESNPSAVRKDSNKIINDMIVNKLETKNASELLEPKIASQDYSTVDLIVQFNNANPKTTKPYKYYSLDEINTLSPIYKIEKLDPENIFNIARNYYLIRFASYTDIEEIIEICGKYKSEILTCEKNFFAKQLSTLDYTKTINNDTWYIDKLNLAKAWKMNIGSRNIKIAVLDEGFDLMHEDLRDNIFEEVSSIKETADNTHGTSMLGLIAGVGNNNKGTSGVMWDASLVPYYPLNMLTKIEAGNQSMTVKTTTTESGNIKNLINIIKDSITKKYRIVYLPFSYAGSVKNGLANKIILEATRNNVIFLSPVSGCDGINCNAQVSPQDFEEVILVKSLDDTLKARPDNNQDNNYNTVSAPGVGLLTTKPGNTYYENSNKFNGTSGAAALVTGVIGLMLSVNEKLDVSDIKNILFSTTIDLGDTGFDKTYGHGLVDACMAVFCSVKDNQKTCFDKNKKLILKESDTICKSNDITDTHKETFPVTQVPNEAPFPKQDPNTNPVRNLIPIPILK